MESTSPVAHQFRLDRDRYQLLDGSSRVRLEKQPMELLILLVARSGQLVTRDEIAATLWGDDVFVDIDRNINSIVRKLRRALKDDPDHPRFLETVIGKGYRFVGPLEILPSRAGLAGENAAHSVTSPNLPKTAQRKLGFAILALIIGAAFTWLAVRRLEQVGTEYSQIRSLAVLPLANVSGDASQEYFADGMTQELTASLAQIGDLRVISHTSVMQYKEGHKSVPEIAKDLHVDALIEGSVLRTRDRVRVTAQLIRAPADQTVWSNTYERDLRDVLSLQRDIADDIAEQVKIKLTRIYVDDQEKALSFYTGSLGFVKKNDVSNGPFTIFISNAAADDAPPTEFALTGVAPNPAVDGARIGFTLPRQSHVRLVVADVTGRTLAVLVDEARAAGRYEARWNGAGPRGTAAAGIYFVRFEAGGRTATRRFALTH